MLVGPFARGFNDGARRAEEGRFELDRDLDEAPARLVPWDLLMTVIDMA